MSFRLFGVSAFRLFGFSAFRLFGFSAFQLFSFSAFRLCVPKGSAVGIACRHADKQQGCTMAGVMRCCPHTSLTSQTCDKWFPSFFLCGHGVKVHGGVKVHAAGFSGPPSDSIFGSDESADHIPLPRVFSQSNCCSLRHLAGRPSAPASVRNFDYR